MGGTGSRGLRLIDLSGFDAAEVQAHLAVLLESPVFRSSQRSRQFLRFVVEYALAGELDLLKERVIGERIFGRPPDYDTGQDSIVRVKANEVRRRLAQYYDAHPEVVLKIDLPAGSYLPAFHRCHPPAEAAPAHASAPPQRRSRRWMLAPLVAGAAAAAWLGVRLAGSGSPFAQFWESFLGGSHELMLCIPTPDSYRIYGGGRDVLIEALRPHPPGQPMPPLNPAKVADVQIVGESGLSLGLGDAHALTLLYAFAAVRGRSAQVRLGSETTFTDLRAGPSVLIGGFTNRWTLDLLSDARFGFAAHGASYGIEDKVTGQFVCRKPAPWEPRRNEDCAVVTRLAHSKTGHPLMVAAGLDHFGTYAVGEYLTRPELLEAALLQAPADWSRKNLQIVFRSEIVRDSVGPPTVLAIHVW